MIINESVMLITASGISAQSSSGLLRSFSQEQSEVITNTVDIRMERTFNERESDLLIARNCG